jgi:hypothetical protein
MTSMRKRTNNRLAEREANGPARGAINVSETVHARVGLARR